MEKDSAREFEDKVLQPISGAVMLSAESFKNEFGDNIIKYRKDHPDQDKELGLLQFEEEGRNADWNDKAKLRELMQYGRGIVRKMVEDYGC